METVYENRLAWGHVAPCPECIGMAAVIEAEHLGDKVWIEGPDGYEGPFLVVDCANAAHLEKLKERRLVAEVDWQTAQRWQMKGPIEGRVLWLEPELLKLNFAEE